MHRILLNFSVLVEQVKEGTHQSYVLRPLFTGEHVVKHQRYEKAISLLKKELRRRFKGIQVNRHNLHYLLWYQFNPDSTFHFIAFNEIIQKRAIRGTFAVARFEIQGKWFVCFPGFYHFLAMIESREVSEHSLFEKRVTSIISKLLKREMKAREDSFELEDYLSHKNSFVTTVQMNINVNFMPFGFESARQRDFFAQLMPSNEFNGALEIERVGYDLNSKYPTELKRAFFTENWVHQIQQLLFGKSNNSIVLIGDTGTGKHTLIEEAVFQYLESQQSLYDQKVIKVWHIDPNRVISGMSVVGQWQKRFEAILHFVQNRISDKKISDKILIDNPVALLRIGKSAQNQLTLSDVLASYIEKRAFQVVLLATPNQWKIIQETDRRFSDLFQIMRIQEASYENAIKIAIAQKRLLEASHDCIFSIQAIKQLFAFQRNYLKQKALPGSVIKFMNQLAVKYKNQLIDAPEIRQEFEFISGLKPRIFDDTVTINEQDITEALSRKLVGQQQAVEGLANAVHLVKARLTDQTKPLASFMFIGPTGVGKTQAAKTINEYLLGSKDHLLRFDMNEYVDSDAVSRLIGSEYKTEGQLTGKVRFKPFSVILLDEIEKAHPTVHDLLLQLLDDARLTDSLGRTTDFSNTIIIMTSNIGAKEVSRQLGFELRQEQEAAIYRRSVEKSFRPEFVNRIDQIIVFEPLRFNRILDIARLQIHELLQRDGFVRRTTMLNISGEALEWVAKRGYNSRMGGRALKRQIERDLTALSAEQLISSYSDQPIILNIFLKEGQLYPKITKLEFADSLHEDWFPKIPDEKKGGRFLGKLIRQLDQLEDRLKEFYNKEDREEVLVFQDDQQTDLDWLYYHFKEKIAQLKEHLSTFQLGFRERYYTEKPATPLRLKRVHTSSTVWKNDSSDKGFRNLVKDRVFQQEGIEELQEQYQLAKSEFDSLYTEFIKYYLKVSFLKLFITEYIDQHFQRVVIIVNSGINGSGAEQEDYLLEKYIQLLKYLDISIQMDEKSKTITIEGYGLETLLSGECGIHLFYTKRRNPIPVIVTVKEKEHATEQAPEVVRVYDQENTLTDIRTGYSNTLDITPEEFAFLLFAGMSAKSYVYTKL